MSPVRASISITNCEQKYRLHHGKARRPFHPGQPGGVAGWIQHLLHLPGASKDYRAVGADVESKKTSHNKSADDSTLVSASLRTARHLHPGSWLTHNRDGERYVRRKQQWWVQGLCTDRYTEGFRFILTENSQLIEWHYIDVTRVCEYTCKPCGDFAYVSNKSEKRISWWKKHALQMRYLHQSLPHISMK